MVRQLAQSTRDPPHVGVQEAIFPIKGPWLAATVHGLSPLTAVSWHAAGLLPRTHLCMGTQPLFSSQSLLLDSDGQHSKGQRRGKTELTARWSGGPSITRIHGGSRHGLMWSGVDPRLKYHTSVNGGNGRRARSLGVGQAWRKTWSILCLSDGNSGSAQPRTCGTRPTQSRCWDGSAWYAHWFTPPLWLTCRPAYVSYQATLMMKEGGRWGELSSDAIFS